MQSSWPNKNQIQRYSSKSTIYFHWSFQISSISTIALILTGKRQQNPWLIFHREKKIAIYAHTKNCVPWYRFPLYYLDQRITLHVCHGIYGSNIWKGKAYINSIRYLPIKQRTRSAGIEIQKWSVCMYYAIDQVLCNGKKMA